jgi:hypothetical protein
MPYCSTCGVSNIAAASYCKQCGIYLYKPNSYQEFKLDVIKSIYWFIKAAISVVIWTIVTVFTFMVIGSPSIQHAPPDLQQRAQISIAVAYISIEIGLCLLCSLTFYKGTARRAFIMGTTVLTVLIGLFIMY